MMTLCQYIEYLNNELSEAKARVIMVPPKAGSAVRMLYKQRGGSEIHISDMFNRDSRVPMPEQLFECIISYLNESATCVGPQVVLGLWGYLSLLEDAHQQRVFIELKKLIAQWPSGRELVCLLWRNEAMEVIAKEIFDNPGYVSGKNLVFIKAEQGEPNYVDKLAGIILVGQHLSELIPESCDTLQKYLRYTEDYSPYTGEISTHRVIIAAEKRVAGLNLDIKQVVCLQDFVSAVYHVNPKSLSEEGLLWMCQKIRQTSSRELLSALMEIFFPDGDLTKNVLNVFEKSNGYQREVLLWFLKEVVPQASYLEYVLKQENVDATTFRSAYVTAASQCLEAAALYREERRVALQGADVTKFNVDILAFITQCVGKNSAQVVPWLNCHTNIEYVELLRRCAEDGYISHAIKEVYPALSAYLSSTPVFEDAYIDAYFKDYRKLKIINLVTSAFYEKVQNTELPLSIPSRDSTIQKYASDPQCTLLVVDAMGAEWLPMLIEIARSRNIGIESLAVCKAQIPSTTHHNPIYWPAPERKSPDIKRFDNIAHNGAEKNEAKQPHENLAAALSIVSETVMPRIEEILGRGGRVLVTADHGTSRLAVLARQTDPKLAQTISCEVGVDILDCRYMKSAKYSLPSQLVETLDGNFWVVCGYDRLPKKGGGSSFEVHGGGSLEELLVPVVVFSRQGQFVPIPRDMQRKQQIVEKDDFDI